MIVSLLDRCTVVFSYDRCRGYCPRPASGRPPAALDRHSSKAAAVVWLRAGITEARAKLDPGLLGPVERGRTEWSVVPSSLLAAATSAWWWRWLVARTAVVASRATSGVSECWRGGQGQRGREAAAQRSCASCNHPPSIAMKALHRSASLQQPIRASIMYPSHRPASRLERQVLARDDVSSIN